MFCCVKRRNDRIRSKYARYMLLNHQYQNSSLHQTLSSHVTMTTLQNMVWGTRNTAHQSQMAYHPIWRHRCSMYICAVQRRSCLNSETYEINGHVCCRPKHTEKLSSRLEMACALAPNRNNSIVNFAGNASPQSARHRRTHAQAANKYYKAFALTKYLNCTHLSQRPPKSIMPFVGLCRCVDDHIWYLTKAGNLSALLVEVVPVRLHFVSVSRFGRCSFRSYILYIYVFLVNFLHSLRSNTYLCCHSAVVRPLICERRPDQATGDSWPLCSRKRNKKKTQKHEFAPHAHA